MRRAAALLLIPVLLATAVPVVPAVQAGLPDQLQIVQATISPRAPEPDPLEMCDESIRWDTFTQRWDVRFQTGSVSPEDIHADVSVEATGDLVAFSLTDGFHLDVRAVEGNTYELEHRVLALNPSGDGDGCTTETVSLTLTVYGEGTVQGSQGEARAIVRH